MNKANRPKPRVGNLLPSKSHLDPFTTARRPMRARIILRSIGHKCFPKKKKKKRSSPVFRVIDLSIISHSLASKNSKRAADGRQKSHMRLRSRGLPTYDLSHSQDLETRYSIMKMSAKGRKNIMRRKHINFW